MTAPGRDINQRDREMAWKLAFLKLVLPNENSSYHPLKPIDKTWLRSGFENFCHKLSKRESLTMPAGINWFKAERAGWQRQGEVMRLSLLRHAVRRAVELWLVPGSRYFCESLFWASKPKQTAKT